jgi:hypothetical protein
MHRQKLSLQTHGWWRFSRYEIQAGVIRPASGSRLIPYDPWIEFQQVRNQTNGQPAYGELVRLVWALRSDPTGRSPRGFSPEGHAKILAWCGRYGLLGNLLARWESVTLSPRPKRGASKLKIQEKYIRSYGNTLCIVRSEGDLDNARSRVLIHGLNDMEIKEEPLAATWHRFFPSVSWHERESFAYPAPYSRRFCELYAEPVMEFWRAARLFADIVEHVGPAGKHERARDAASKGTETLAREQATHSLNLLRRGVSQVLCDGKEGLRQEWSSPSLLASFAEMFGIDAFAGARVQYCGCCGAPFISESYQARYCSLPCRLRQQKRNLRAQIKQSRSAYLQGQTIREISKNLGEAPKIVSKWVSDLRRRRQARRS